MRLIARGLTICAALFAAIIGIAAGIGRRLSRQAGEDHRAVRARRPDRRDGAADRAEAVGKPEAAILCREPSRRRRQYRHDGGREIGARRLHHPGRQLELRGQSEPLCQKNPYDPFKDFAPITLAAASPNILVVNPEIPAKTVKELIDLLKANPGQIHHRQSRHRHDAATRRRTVQADLQARRHERAVRRRRPGDPVRRRRPYADRVLRAAADRAAGAGRQAARAGGHLRQALAGACRTCRPWRKPASRARNRRPCRASWCRPERRRRSSICSTARSSR